MNREEAINVLKENIPTEIIFEDEEVQKRMVDLCEAIDMTIEALSQPNYETDTEVRLAVTNRKKEKVILWDAYGEAEYYPIEALSAEPTDLISRADAEAFVCMERCGEYRKDCPAQTCPIIEHLDSIPSAGRPTELLKDGTLKVNVQNGADVNRVLICGDDGFGGLYYADDRPNIAYFCDGAACDGECNECHHTTDIKHAKNFNCIGGKYNIKYIETDYRPSGEWIMHIDDLYPEESTQECTNCHEHETIKINNDNYCPNCGAKMGGNK